MFIQLKLAKVFKVLKFTIKFCLHSEIFFTFFDFFDLCCPYSTTTNILDTKSKVSSTKEPTEKTIHISDDYKKNWTIFGALIGASAIILCVLPAIYYRKCILVNGK